MFHPYVWYEREVQLPDSLGNKRVLLNFQAVDYIAKVWVNGSYAGGTKAGMRLLHWILPMISTREPEQ